jgi:hypothetical protein
MSLDFDTSDFDRKFMRIVKETVPELVIIGLGRAILQLLNDCVMEIPTVPLKEGWLRGSGSVFVQNKLSGVSGFGRPGFANKTHIDNIGRGEFVGVCGFNTPYAARLHEGIGFHFTEPSSGAKYMEKKLHGNKDRYQEIIANAIKEGGK